MYHVELLGRIGVLDDKAVREAAEAFLRGCIVLLLAEMEQSGEGLGVCNE